MEPSWPFALLIVAALAATAFAGGIGTNPTLSHPSASTTTPVTPAWTDLNLPLPNTTRPGEPSTNFCSHVTSSFELVDDLSDGFPLALVTAAAADGYCNNEYFLEGEAWADAGTGPDVSGDYGPLTNFAVTYDPALGAVLTYGGGVCEFNPIGGPCSATLAEYDTWTFHAGTWTELSTTNTPGPGAGHGPGALAYDEGDGQALLVSGTQTWAFSAGDWTNLTNASQPPDLPFVLSSDSTTGGVLWLAGGCTWQFLHGSWSNLTGSLRVVPTFTSPPMLTDDPAVGGALLFGGATNDTWGYSGEGWTNLTEPSGSPTARTGSGATYDPSASGLLLWGGFATQAAEESTLNDTWYFGTAPPAHPLAPGSAPTPPTPSSGSGLVGEEPLVVGLIGAVLVAGAAGLIAAYRMSASKSRRSLPGPSPPPPSPPPPPPSALS